MKMVTVFMGFNLAEVQLVRSRLEAAGFEPFVMNENSALSVGVPAAVGGIKVQVPEDQYAEAKEFLDTPLE